MKQLLILVLSLSAIFSVTGQNRIDTTHRTYQWSAPWKEYKALKAFADSNHWERLLEADHSLHLQKGETKFVISFHRNSDSLEMEIFSPNAVAADLVRTDLVAAGIKFRKEDFNMGSRPIFWTKYGTYYIPIHLRNL